MHLGVLDQDAVGLESVGRDAAVHLDADQDVEVHLDGPDQDAAKIQYTIPI